MKTKIFFYKADVKVKLSGKKEGIKLIENLFKTENKNLTRLNYVFCSDNYLQKINKKFLNHDTLTDVITFLLSTQKQPVIAEIYISTERVQENAKNYQVSYQNELLRVMIHGALHLCGYSDKSKSKKEIMRKREDFYLNKF